MSFKGILLLLILMVGMGGCAMSLQWIPESSTQPSCSPDRLPTWDDFSIQDPPSGTPAAQTAIRFLVRDSPPYLLAKLDPKFSWVKSNAANPVNSDEWTASQKLLAHEQVHFLISCLLVREANQSLHRGEDPQKMVELVKAVAQRINVQYDQDTQHGTLEVAQAKWEAHVQRQFEEVTAGNTNR